MKFHTSLAVALCAATLIPAVRAESPLEAEAIAATTKLGTQLAEGKWDAAYNALPAEYRNKFAELVKTFAGNMDAELWSQGQKTISQLAGVAAIKSDLLLDMAKQHAAADADPADIRADLIRGATKVAAVAKAANLDALKEGKIAEILATPAVVKEGLTDNLPPVKIKNQFTAKAEEDGTVTVTDEKGKSTVLKKVGTAWVPAEMDAFFSGEEYEKAKKSAAEFKLEEADKQQAKALFSMLSGAAKQAMSAKTQEELMGSVMMPMMMMGGMMQSMPIPGAAPQK